MNKKLKKGLTVSSAAAMGMSIVLPTVSVIAAPAVTNGWVNQNGTWYYYNNGTLVKNGWAKDSKGWCFLNAVDGAWVQEGWAKDSTGWGYIRAGYWVEHATYAKDANGWQFIGANGYWDTTVAVSATNPIDDATAAVVKAEGSKLAADVDAAKALVAKLQDAIPEKAALTTRLNAVVTNFEVASVTVVDALHIKVVFTQAVDEDTAEDASNYSFDGNDDWVNEATLQEDGKTVILELNDDDALTNDSDDDYTVKITDVENKDGKVIDDYKEVLSLYDDVKPEIKSVEMTDRDTLEIQFSEDIKTKGDITIYDEDGEDIDVSDADIEIDGDDASIIKVTGLGSEDEGDYTVEVKNTKDFAGNKIAETTKDFTMEEDNTDPDVSSVKAVSATTLKVTFDEAIDLDAGLSVVVSGNGHTYTLDESDATVISGTGKKSYYVNVGVDLDDDNTYKVVVSGYSDFSENEGDSYTKYVKFDNEIGAELESTEATIKSYGGDKYAVFTYDMDVCDDVKLTTSLDGTYEDEDGDTIDVSIPVADIYTSTGTGSVSTLDDLDDNQVAIKLSDLKIGDYTVTFDDGFVVTNAVESDETDVTFSVTSEEDSETDVVHAVVDGSKVYVIFNDEVDGATALDTSNYTVDGDEIFDGAKFVSYTYDGETYSATDKQVVKLSVADDTDPYVAKTLKVKDIVDANDNDVDEYTQTVSIASTVGPQVDDVLLTSLDTITVVFDEPVMDGDGDDFNEVTKDDFRVTVDGADVAIDTVEPANLADGGATTWTITLKDSIDEDYTTVKAGTSADFDGEDEDGNTGEVGKLLKADIPEDEAPAPVQTVDEAKAAVYDAQLALDALVNPTDGAVATATANVAANPTNAAVAAATAAVAANPTDAAVAAATDAVAADPTDLELAQANVVILDGSSTVDEVAAAQLVVDARDAAVAGQAVLDARDAAVAGQAVLNARAAYTAAEADLAAAQAALDALLD